MKKLISLLMTLVMLTGTCAVFAEAEAVDHQAALEALLAEAGVELQPGDLSRPFEKALGNTVAVLILTHTRMTEEQLTEWEAVKAAVREETEALKTEDAEQSVRIFNEAIDGMKSITPFTKSMLKRVIFDGMYQRSAVTEKERQMIQAIYNALEAELHGADEARTGEIVAGIKAGMEELVGLHNARDDMMFILEFLQEANSSLAHVEEDDLARVVLTAAGQVMEDLAGEIDAALAALSAIDEEPDQAINKGLERNVAALERMDVEELAEAKTHVSELANAVVQGDQEALKEHAQHLMRHIEAQNNQRNYEVLMGMADEELRTLAIELLEVAYDWQSDKLDGSLRDALKALELNWSDLSEEDMAAIRDAVTIKVETMEIPEGAREKAVDMMTNNIIVMNGFSKEEKALTNVLYELLYLALENKKLDAAQLVELENEMETLLYELAGDSEKYAVTPEDLAAVLENVDLEKVESLSDNAKFFLSIRFMEHLEVYSMLTEEYRAKLPEVDQALLDAIKGLEVKGQETTMEQLQVLEKVIYDVLSQMDIPVEVLVKEVAETVSNCLFMSALTAEEQETIEAVLEAISQTLAEGNREEIRVLRNYYHQVQHHMEEGQVKPQLQNDQA